MAEKTKVKVGKSMLFFKYLLNIVISERISLCLQILIEKLWNLCPIDNLKKEISYGVCNFDRYVVYGQ